MTRLTLLTLALIGVAGLAQAQQAMRSDYNEQATAPTTYPDRMRHETAITDEYGFHYDSRGDRLNAQGHVIAPPQTQPGARVIQNGG